MKKKGLFILALLAFNSTYAQFESIMKSGTSMSLGTLQGTARYVGTGGVISSVGGDITNLSTNPAGLGMFSRTELSFTPTLGVHNVHNNFQYINGSSKQGTTSDNNRTKLLFNSMGIVIANRKSDKDKLRASNIGIGLNRIADFNRTIEFGVENNRVYSYSNYLGDIATYFNDSVPSYPRSGLPVPDDYVRFDNLWNQTLIARNSELIAYSPNDTAYIDATPHFRSGLNVRQFGQNKITGGINELSFAWAGNYSDKYYLGVSLGIPFMNYKSEFTLSEDNNGGSLTHNVYGKLNYMDISQTDQFSGVGVNIKLGGLAKITKDLKVSAYIHSPTFYQVTNDYVVGIKVGYENSTNNRTQAVNESPYNLITPFKVGGGISHMLGKFGFVGVEYEFNNLKNLTVDIEDAPEANSYMNATLKKNNQDFHIFRLGTELVIPEFGTDKQSPFRLRFGYNYRTAPKNAALVSQKGDQVAHTYTAGFGIRGKSVSLDLAYMKSQYRDYEYIYDYNGDFGKFEFSSASWNTLNQFMATLNFRFN
jgi:hypothetical protein